MKVAEIKDQKSPGSRAVRVFKINSSSRLEDSVTRQLSDRFIEKLKQEGREVRITERDLSNTVLPYIDQAWISASYTQAHERSDEQHKKLLLSDQLIKELQDADIVIIGAPIYNFSIPAALKAWIDLVARPGVTFRYTGNGPVGLLDGKKAYLILASGGVSIGGDADFASSYLRHVLNFIGIHEVEVIAAERLNTDKQGNLQKAQGQIQRAVSLIQVSQFHAA